FHVTGVQTCALPIFCNGHRNEHGLPVRLQRHGLDAPDRHATQLDVIALHDRTDRTETCTDLLLLGAEDRTAQEDRAKDDEQDPGKDDCADEDIVASPHAPTSCSSSGLPSMNPFTTGSSVARISSGVPTCRMPPLYSIAMRSPTRYALVMSCVTTMLVTPSSSFMRNTSRSMTVVVTGSRPVVGSS